MVKIRRVQNLGGVTYEKFDEKGMLHIIVLTKRKEEKEGVVERESQILEMDKIKVCAEQDPKNDLDITSRGGGGV